MENDLFRIGPFCFMSSNFENKESAWQILVSNGCVIRIIKKPGIFMPLNYNKSRNRFKTRTRCLDSHITSKSLMVISRLYFSDECRRNDALFKFRFLDYSQVFSNRNIRLV